jgi:hypothetical protein
MNEPTCAPTLAALQAQREAALAALPDAEAVLAAADAAVIEAQAVYDAAGRDMIRVQRDPATRTDAAAVTAARATFDQADTELGAALVARTEASKRRGALRLAVRRSEQQEAQLAQEQARAQAERRPNGLAGIRARLFGGVPVGTPRGKQGAKQP